MTVLHFARAAWPAGCLLLLACKITFLEPNSNDPSSNEPAPSGAIAASSSVAVESQPVDPYAERPCPSALGVDAGPRTIDTRRPKDSARGGYSKDHMKAFTPEQGFSKEAGLEAVFALEAKNPGLVPEGFRAQLAEHGKEPAFRLYMSRCARTSIGSVRRAVHDAAIAFLLGADHDTALEATRKARSPVPNRHNCDERLKCEAGLTCDSVTGYCSNELVKSGEFTTKLELDVEEILVRTLAAQITHSMLGGSLISRIEQFVPANLVTRCGGNALCHVQEGLAPDATSYDQHAMLWWDRRYVGVSRKVELTDSEKRCKSA